MCHERWTRRWRRQDEEFDEELRFMFEEAESAEPPVTVVEDEPAEQPADPKPERVEAGV